MVNRLISTYRAIIIEKLKDLSTIKSVEKPFSPLASDHVLVKMKYSTVNPSDLNTAMGGYPGLTSPSPLGLEGCGTVVEVASNSLSYYLNKRVAVKGQGTWAEYLSTSVDNIFELQESTSDEQAANMIINPMTVCLMMEIIKKQENPSVILNAAASSLGKILNKWAAIEKVKILNLVRREDQVQALKKCGAEHVLIDQDGWKDRASEWLSKEGEVCVGFDAVGGKATGEMMEIVREGGVVYNYGRLSGEDCRVPSYQIMMLRKKLEGLWLMPWLNEKSRKEREDISWIVQSMISNVFASEFSRVTDLDGVKEELINFKKVASTNNKVLVRTCFS